MTPIEPISDEQLAELEVEFDREFDLNLQDAMERKP